MPAQAALRAPVEPTARGGALAAAQLAKVRALCAQLPEVIERPSHGSPAFLVQGKRAMAYFCDGHHGDGRLALWCAAPEGAQAMWIDSDPERFFLPPYVAHLGWVGVRLDRGLPWPQIAMVLEAAHQVRYRAPRARSAAPPRARSAAPRTAGAAAPRARRR